MKKISNINIISGIEEVEISLETLKGRERDVIKMYFGISRDYALTLNEIGEEFNLTRERVRQIIVNKQFIRKKDFK